MSLPKGFKHVPSEPGLAVSKDGKVINALTLLGILVQEDESGKFITFSDSSQDIVRNERKFLRVEDLIDETFGVKWWDIPEFPAYRITEDGKTVVNKSTREAVKIHTLNGDPFVLLFKSGRDRDPYAVTIEQLLNRSFDDEKCDQSEPTPKEEPGRIDPKTKTIAIRNSAIALEGLKQIQRTKGRHYPGPLRDQTIYDLIDHLVKELEKPENQGWRRIRDFPDYEINHRGEVRNLWTEEPVPYLPAWTGFELRHVSGDWIKLTLNNAFKLAGYDHY